jgi:hypothetical protein
MPQYYNKWPFPSGHITPLLTYATPQDHNISYTILLKSHLNCPPDDALPEEESLF